MTGRLWALLSLFAAILAAAGVTVSRPAEVRFLPDRALTFGPIDQVRMFAGRLPWDPAEHRNFANRCLVVRCLEVVNQHEFADPKGRWSFQQLVRNALTKGCKPDCPKSPDQWVSDFVHGYQSQAFNEILSLWPANTTLDTIPLRLLAVVNRMDLAKVSDAKCKALDVEHPGGGKDAQVCGAEVRFVYAGINGPGDEPYLALILEFVLPPMSKTEFLKLAGLWTKLEHSRDFFGDLTSALTASLGGPELANIKSARIRANGTQGRVWYFAQTALYSGTNTQPPPAVEPLDQQPKSAVTKCWPGDSLLAKIANSKDVEHDQYEFDAASGLQTTEAFIQPTTDSEHVLTFAKRAVSDKKRLAISINSCTGCHGFETVNTDRIGYDSPFDQIKFRKANEQSKLSHFLSGEGNGSEPSMARWSVRSIPVLQDCCADHTPEPGKFNDLWRRHDFFDALRKLHPSDTDGDWVKALEATSLVAWQSH